MFGARRRHHVGTGHVHHTIWKQDSIVTISDYLFTISILKVSLERSASKLYPIDVGITPQRPPESAFSKPFFNTKTIDIFILRKNEKQEDILTGYITYLDQLSRVIEVSDEKLKKIDEWGIFKSDDEIGFMYEQIKSLQGILSQFRVEKSWMK